MASHPEIQDLKPFEARAIVESLRKGSVPVESVSLFTVGRHQWLKYIEDDLEHYIADGGSKVRFINGDYGDGKTHFMSIIRHLAIRKNFAVSFVVLTREVPIHKFEIVYQEIVRQLSGSFAGLGIRSLLDSWTDGLKADMTRKGEPSFNDRLLVLAESLRNLPGMDLNFANALVALVNLKFSLLNDDESKDERAQSQETLYQWFQGGKIAKRDLKPFQIFEGLTKTNSKRLLNSLIVFLRHGGYNGFILLIDELETILSQSTSVRNAGYENVRLLIDNSEKSHHLHIFFSIIPDVLLAEKGFKSYDALWSRVRSIGDGKRLNFRSILVDLHRTPLEPKELVELGKLLRRLHENAYRWQSEKLLNDKLIKEICDSQEKMGLITEVRLFIKQIIRHLDMAEQGIAPEINEDLTDQIFQCQREVEREKVEQLQPKWDS